MAPWAREGIRLIKMRIPTIKGLIRRRVLANFRADPEAVRKILPPVFRPKLQAGNAIVGVCLIRLESIRPAGFPGFAGISSENAAHRIAVRWKDGNDREREGVYIARRDTGSLLNRIAGGRVFPGEHARARFEVSFDGKDLDFSMASRDGKSDIRIKGKKSPFLPEASCFGSLSEASEFFRGGSTGYSVTKDPDRLDGLVLETKRWEVSALEVDEIHSGFYFDESRFPKGSLRFDNALLMENIPHLWHGAEDLRAGRQAAG